MNHCFLSLGSNLGDRLASLQAARDQLRAIADPEQPFRQSPVYESDPLDCPPNSPPFLNTAVCFHFSGDAPALLAATQAIETSLGRPQERETNAPRAIDIDILVFGQFRLTSPELTLPHPRLHLRRFVLQPLADLDPGLTPAQDGLTVERMLSALADPDQACRPILSEW